MMGRSQSFMQMAHFRVSSSRRLSSSSVIEEGPAPEGEMAREMRMVSAWI